MPRGNTQNLENLFREWSSIKVLVDLGIFINLDVIRYMIFVHDLVKSQCFHFIAFI